MNDLTLRADHHELRKLRPWLDDGATNVESAVLARIELCLHELAANVIDHSGAGEMSLHLDHSPHRLLVELYDQGSPLKDPTAQELAPHPRIRGYGMMIAQQLAGELSYERRGKVNIWRAIFDLPT